jgi:hypothetical protein
MTFCAKPILKKDLKDNLDPTMVWRRRESKETMIIYLFDDKIVKNKRVKG